MDIWCGFDVPDLLQICAPDSLAPTSDDFHDKIDSVRQRSVYCQGNATGWRHDSHRIKPEHKEALALEADMEEGQREEGEN